MSNSNSINKKDMSERDICSKYIMPALQQAGWDSASQIREEVTFTAGKIIVRGEKAKRGPTKRADYILYHKPNLPIAVIEAKDNNHSLGDGMQQALEYSNSLDVPFVFSSNGDGFLFHDKTNSTGTIEIELGLDEFPSSAELWQRYRRFKKLADDKESIYTHDYYSDPLGKTPRYYQQIAVNRTVEAVSRGQNRILLVMATGTGKTFVAFQTIWRLWKSGTKKRILFLADRDVLIKQTQVNDFKPFKSAMTRIQKRQIDKSYEIYLTLYQSVTGSEDHMNIFKQFSPGFFDLVIVDECHRGSVEVDSQWRAVLDYFSAATHIGLTATPKETKTVSNIDYFGEPVYTYSLKEGIEDGFLAPYKVIRIDIDKDLEGWRPEEGKRDKHGKLIKDRIYNQKDFDKTLVLDQRTELVASRITEFLQKTDPYSKTIVFCEDIDHAERMRQALANLNPTEVQKNDKYIMRITGDSPEGKAELDNFIDPESRYPVIATTSKLMSTGVDAQTCKLIVLDQTINSMTEFKQIIGRGTRIKEEFKKLYFTIMDFKKATELFADPDFDGPPIQIYEPGKEDSVVPPEVEEGESAEESGFGEVSEEGDEDEVVIEGDFEEARKGKKRQKFYVDDVPAHVVGERIQYYGPDGKLITESLKDFTRKRITKEFSSLDDFLQKWTTSEQKAAIIEELEDRGVLLDALAEEVGRDYGPFDLICHVAFGQPPLTRTERANNVRKRNYFGKYSDTARAVLEALLDKYSDEGIENIEDINVLRVKPLDSLGTPVELIKAFGTHGDYLEAVRELKEELYKAA